MALKRPSAQLVCAAQREHLLSIRPKFGLQTFAKPHFNLDHQRVNVVSVVVVVVARVNQLLSEGKDLSQVSACFSNLPDFKSKT